MKKYLVCQEDSDHRIWSALPIIVRVMYRVGCLLAARELGDGAGCGGAGLEGGALHSAPLPRLVVRRGLIAEASQRLAADGAFAERADADGAVQLAGEIDRSRKARGHELDGRDHVALEVDRLGPVEAEDPEDAQRLDEALVQADEEDGVLEPFALEVHRHELCLFVVDVAQRELADRRGEVELPEDRERLVALLPTVPEDVRRQQALLDHRLHGERACLLYTSDAADDLLCVDLGGRRIIKK